MKNNKTLRGFDITSFRDTFNNECSLQKSSSIDDRIWLGLNNSKLTVFEDDSMGKYLTVDMPKNFDVDTRMHLNRKQVAELLPYLQKFVETGDINDDTYENE